MDKRILTTLLYIIRENKDIFGILDLGIEVSQIPQIVKFAHEEGLINNKDKLTLTNKGEKFLMKNIISANKRSYRIEPAMDARGPKIGLDEIYLPPKIVYHKF
jgi:predicted methyltransferase